TDDPGLSFAELEKLIGLRNARRTFQTWRRSALDFAALLRRLEIRCALEPRTTVTVAATTDQVARLNKDQKARREAGTGAPLLNARAVRGDASLDASAGLRTREAASIDPYRACIGLAAAAAERGALLFERSPVKRITFNRKTAEVFTTGGSIRTSRVIVATGLPTPLFQPPVRAFWLQSACRTLTEPLPAKVRQQMARHEIVIRDASEPPHVVRWVGDDRVLVCGADAESVPARQRDKIILQRTGQLMYEL